MSDIFISYAREDRALAEALANDLKARGYSVWWDTELVGSDDFQDVILAALAKARAAIVIWTKASVKSLFVRDEARYALHYKKLVAVKQPDLDVLDIPFGFQGQHTDHIHDRERVIRAVTKLGVMSASSQSAADTWETVRHSSDAGAVLKWLEDNPTHEKRLEAFRRVRLLMEAGDKAAEAQETPQAIARTSSVSAFLSGLALRMPSFQLSAQGTWRAIGQAIALVVVLVIGIRVAFDISVGMAFGGASIVGLAMFALALSLLIRIAVWQYSAFVSQRLFAGAGILSPMLLLLAGSAGYFAAFVFFIVIYNDVPGLVPPTVAAVGASIGLVLAVVYMIRKVRSVR